MYLDENSARYPFHALRPTLITPTTPVVHWSEELQPFYKVSWTNKSYHCPAYKGKISLTGDGFYDGVSSTGSYAYNRGGTDLNGGTVGSRTFLGLSGSGAPSTSDFVPAIRESQVLFPSELFAMADSRVEHVSFAGSSLQEVLGIDFLAFDSAFLRDPPERSWISHRVGFNALHCDGHVSLIKYPYFTNPTNSWRNLNNDHQPHAETWQ